VPHRRTCRWPNPVLVFGRALLSRRTPAGKRRR